MPLVTGDNGIVYASQGTKPVEQVLDEKWFNWFSGAADLKDSILTQTKGSAVTLDEATEIVRQYAVETVFDDDSIEGSISTDILQTALNFTDWRHLSRRLCDIFGITLKP